MYNLAVRLLLLPYYKKSTNNNISKGLAAHSIEFDLCKIQCWLGRSRLNVFLKGFEHFFMHILYNMRMRHEAKMPYDYLMRRPTVCRSSPD